MRIHITLPHAKCASVTNEVAVVRDVTDAERGSLMAPPPALDFVMWRFFRPHVLEAAPVPGAE